MIFIRIIVLAILSVFHTSLIGTVNGENEDRQDFRTCFIKIRREFELHNIDTTPKEEFVKKAIKTFNNTSQIPTMDKHVREYYLSFYEHLSPDKLLYPAEFCTVFVEEKIIKLEKALGTRIHAYNTTEDDLIRFLTFQRKNNQQKWEDCCLSLSENRMDLAKKDVLLKDALYNRRQCRYFDLDEPNSFKPTTYDYYYLEDIAEKVVVNDGLLSPTKFCLQKYPRVTEDEILRIFESYRVL